MSMLRRVLDRESIVKSNLTDNLVDCVKELQLKYTAERGKTLTNDESTNTLCWILEAMFIHGLKNTFFKSVSSALASSREAQIPEPSFWEFVLIFCHQEVIVQINSLSHIHSDIGRCRAWLRLVLNDGLLISYIQLMLMDKKTLKYYFKPSAFLRDSERCDIMKSYLYGIESYDFQLATNSSLLNCWNSGPLSLIGLWTPADTVFQGVDVAGNMDSKDLQAIPTLKSQSNTPPKPSFFPFEHAYRTPLLEEDEALRVILSSRASTYSEQRSSTSNASSRRSSDQHSPLSSLTTALPVPFAGSSTEISTKSEHVGKRGHTKSKVNQEEKKERKRADKLENTVKPQVATASVPVSFNSGGIQNDGDHMFVSSTPICGPDTLSNRPELDEESCPEGIISCCPTTASDVTTPVEEETSYAALFQSYNRSDSVIGTPITVGSFLDSSQFLLPLRSQNETTASSDPALGSSIEDNHSASITPVDTLGFEVLSREETSKAYTDSIQKDNSILRRIANEVGLDEQNYKCRDCGRLVGMIYGAARVCWFTGYYYCTECHVSEEFVIPARILLNWDFAKYSVCKKSKEALQAAWEQPILDISEINNKLYNEVQECADLMVLRKKLQSISIYLRTCKEPIMKEFNKYIWPKEYLYEEVHSYSLADLLNIPNRTLAVTLTKQVNFGRNHIKNCAVCRQKGFVCEMCRDPKVIFPFDLELIFKCLSCGAVYHNKCMNHSIACPRCVRWKIDSYAAATDITSL